jgi:peptide deformylase
MHIDNEIRRIVQEMLETMYAHRGLGLAAPQVAIPYQLFVMNPTGDANQREQERVLINPVLDGHKGTIEAEEGCLSFPDLFQKVRRSKHVHVQAYDPLGKLIDENASDLVARILQHETDHLHGILFIDKFGPIARLASRDDLAHFERDFRKAQEHGDLGSDKVLMRDLQLLETKQQPRRPPPA